jgi:selenocysteine-specific elongation factor
MADALLVLHGVTRMPDREDVASTRVRVAHDAQEAVAWVVMDAVGALHAADPLAPGMPLTEARALAVATLRQSSGAGSDELADAADAILVALVRAGTLRRDGDVVAIAGHRPATPDPARAAAMDRLLAALDVAAPPALREAAAVAGCPPDAVRELERDGRIVVVDDDLGWASPAWERLRDQALALARTGPLTPAALRDASGTSRKYVMALLEDLQRRGILTRTAAGHVPGPRS